MKNLRHFVVTPSHRDGFTPGLIIAKKGRPSPAQAIRLLRIDIEPGRKESVQVVEVKPVLLSEPRTKREMTGDQRARLIAKWASRFYDMTESWNGPLGMQLAYLFAAIARSSHVALTRNSARVRLLRQETVPANNPIWRFIQIEE